MAANGDSSLEEHLREAGKKLQQPYSSVEGLVGLLEQVAYWLSRMESIAAESIGATLSPLLTALVAKELVWHTNIDVNVAVASCICELLRITAPDPPYQDNETLQDILELIVHCLKNLSDTTSPLYYKRIKILETMADFRLGALMLDSECEVLIAEMFEIFIETIRDDQPETFFTLMETIMTEIIELFEDGEDIPAEIIAPLLAAHKKDNQEVLPIAVNLAKNVIEKCADKLRPHLIEAIKYLDTSVDDYSDLVASICEEDPSPTESESESPPQQIHQMPDGKIITAGQASGLGEIKQFQLTLGDVLL